MQLRVADHPFISHRLTLLHDKNTSSPVLRQLVDKLTTLLTYESTRGVRAEEAEAETPLTETTGGKLTSPDPIVIPVLRAGLGMLEGMARLPPTTEVGFLGMKRDGQTLVIETYANRLPQDLSGRQCFLVDPMLATGGTLVAVISYVLERGARDITYTYLLATPENIAAVKNAMGNYAEAKIVAGGVDDYLSENTYIVPGLGDTGDRLYGLVQILVYSSGL